MSYEGRVQVLCVNGHYDIYDVYDEVDRCDVCSALFTWQNTVDDTNGYSEGFIRMDDYLITPEQSEVCNLGHKHITQYATYRVPPKSDKSDVEVTFREPWLAGCIFLDDEGRRVEVLSEHLVDGQIHLWCSTEGLISKIVVESLSDLPSYFFR